MHESKIICVNPNCKNIYLEKRLRQNHTYGFKGYENILSPLAKNLMVQKQNFPMTIIYMKLKYCAFAYALFERILHDQQYVSENKIPSNRLFCQLHAVQITPMKEEILEEIKKSDSKIRVIFATTALGMGVDSPYVTSVLHISPPFSIEDYMQEIGRAGRGNSSATATLYYNKSDIADNKVFAKDSMKEYCRLDMCLRKYLLEHFGFELIIQDNCCIFCDVIDLELSMSNISIVKYRKIKDNECEEKLICDIQTALSEWKSRLADIYPIFTVLYQILRKVLLKKLLKTLILLKTSQLFSMNLMYGMINVGPKYLVLLCNILLRFKFIKYLNLRISRLNMYMCIQELK